MAGKQRRPRLRASLVFWDAKDERYKMTTPKTAMAAKILQEKGTAVEAVFLLTNVLDPVDAKSIAQFRECMVDSEIGACFYSKGPVTYDMLKGLGLM